MPRTKLSAFGAWLRVWLRFALAGLGRFFLEHTSRAWQSVCRLCASLAALVVRGTNIYFRKKAPRSAAAFSFHVVFSIFPLLICINWMVGRLHTDLSSALSTLSRFLPASAIDILRGYLDYIAGYTSDTALMLGIFMMLLPASAALRNLQGILNDINNRGRRTGIRAFLLSFVFSVVFLLVVYICMIIMFTGSWLLRLLSDRFGIGSYIFGWNWLRFLVLFLLISFMLYILYRFLPFNGRRPRALFSGSVFVGALFSSVTLVGVSILFSYFIGLSSRYSLVYGSLASVIIMMLWLYVCSNVIIIGGIVNRLYNEHRRRKGLTEAAAKAVRGAGRSGRAGTASKKSATKARPTGKGKSTKSSAGNAGNKKHRRPKRKNKH